MTPNYFVLDPKVFGEPGEVESSIERIHAYIRNHTEANDDPESTRHHLDDPCFLQYLDLWLYNQPFRIRIREYFGVHETLYIKYIRYRSPHPQRGQQHFHRDWHRNPQTRRLEVFIALDDSNRSNGATEIIDPRNKREILEIRRGGVVAIDSSAIHRGTNNTSGASRRLISLQVGIKMYGNETYVLGLPSN